MMKFAKTALMTLLLMALVVQPVVFSYAMASINHHTNSHVAHHTMGHASEHHDSMMMHRDMNAHHEMAMQDNGDDNSSSGNCCDSPACGGAPISHFSMEKGTHCKQSYLFTSATWIAITLPSEIKPPRRHFG